uniref:Uncharacterized protein n=1 Tax=Oryza sativa subsp. japonica TaxID=39947 RepID=Q6Z6U6_ORYSJ|nr:hypothetical protein [Oryza sativa Japonica Group]BAD28864.1 hypothetical protein [Oryza sativa Japonica Group]
MHASLICRSSRRQTRHLPGVHPLRRAVFSILASIQTCPSRHSSFASKPSPLALLPASIPSIPGDETTFGGFARNSSTILLLVASAEEAPFAVGIAEK